MLAPHRTPLFALVGYSGSGKTTLLETLVQRWSQQGIRIGVVKHTHHDIDPDRPGKDSWRHRRAGAAQVTLVGPKRWILTRELSDDAQSQTDDAGKPHHDDARLAEVLTAMTGNDLILIEGFKTAGVPKLEVWSSALARVPLAASDPWVRGLAVDDPEHPAMTELRAQRPDVAMFSRDDVAAVALWLRQQTGLGESQRTSTSD